MTAEERAEAMEEDLAREIWKHNHDTLTVKEAREGPVRAVLVRHILAARREAEKATIERCNEEVADTYRGTPTGNISARVALEGAGRRIRALRAAYEGCSTVEEERHEQT